MKTILLWDPRFPNRKPARLTVDDAVASAAVRSGCATAANPAEAGTLGTGEPLDPTMLTEVVMQQASGALCRVFLPYSVVVVGASVGIMASIGTPITGSVVPTPTPSVTISSAIAQTEGNAGTTAFVYTVTRSVSAGAVVVPWSFMAGATSAADFVGGLVPTGGNLTYADGEASKTITINVQGDTAVESDETFTVLISTPNGYVAGAATSATGTVLNDDVPAATTGIDYLHADGPSQVQGRSQANVYDQPRNKTWILRQRWDGATGTRRHSVSIYDHTTNTLGATFDAATDPYPDDDHGLGSIARDNDGYWHFVGGPHNLPNFKYSSTSAPDDPSTFVDRTANYPTTSNSAFGLTYGAIININGVLFIFARQEDTTNMKYGFFKSTSIVNGVATWSAFTTLIDLGPNSRAYGGVVGIKPGTTDIIGLSCTYANGPDTIRHDAYFMEYNTTTGESVNLGATYTRSAASQPTPQSVMDANFKTTNASGAGKATAGGTTAYASDGKVHFIFAETDSYGAPPARYYAHSWDGTQFTPRVLLQTIETGAFISAALQASPNGAMELLYVLDSQYGWGRGGDIFRRTYTPAGGWGVQTQAYSASKMYPLNNIFAVPNGHPDLRFTFCEIATGLGASAPTQYGGNLRTFGYGVNGILSRTYADQAEVAAYYSAAGVTTPNATYRRALNDLYTEIKALGITGSLDALYVLDNESPTLGKRNLLKDAFHATEAGGLTWGNGGVQGNAIDGALITGFTPSSAGGQYAQNAASVLLFSMTEGPAAEQDAGLNVNPSGGGFYANVMLSGGASRDRVNSAGGTTGAVAVTAVGLLNFYRRTGSVQGSISYGVGEGAGVGGDHGTNNSSTGLPTSPITLFKSAGTSITYSGRKFSFMAIGRFFGGGTNYGVLRNIMVRYLLATGALTKPNVGANLLRMTEDITSASWTKGASLTVSLSDTLAPDNVSPAFRLRAAASGSAALLSQGPVPAIGNSLAIAVYARSRTGANQTALIGGLTVTLTPAWKRYSTINTGNGWQLQPGGGSPFTDIDVCWPTATPGNSPDPYRARA